MQLMKSALFLAAIISTAFAAPVESETSEVTKG
jgi:hypothetical protein